MKKKCVNFTKFCQILPNFPKALMNLIYKIIIKINELIACTFHTENLNISTFSFFIVYILNSNQIG